MGQKTNPIILRIGKIKEWKSKYIEKKPTESSIVIFRDLEIKKFIFRLFAKNELRVQNCRVYYSESSLHVYVSYYSTIKLSLLNKKTKLCYTNTPSTLFQTKTTNIKQTVAKKQVYLTKTYKKTLFHPLTMKLFQNHYLLRKKTHRLNAVKNFKVYLSEKNRKTLDQQKTNVFVATVLKSLNLFTENKQNIFLNLRQTNKENDFLKTVSKKKKKRRLTERLTKLRKFYQNEFFKNGFNMLHNFMINQQSSTFLAEFIAVYFKKLKRPNFFLRFLKLALKMLLAEKFAKFKRIKIKIKGRFNGAPRSRHKFINIGKNVPVLTIHAKIDYGESTAYTSNGTFGIKVWTYAATLKNYHV